MWGRRGDIASHFKNKCLFKQKKLTEREKIKLQEKAEERVHKLKKEAAKSVFRASDGAMIARAKLFFEPFGLIEEWDEFQRLGENAIEEDKQKQDSAAVEPSHATEGNNKILENIMRLLNGEKIYT